jgi:NitT/TauT family transport system substrate-binding protein
MTHIHLAASTARRTLRGSRSRSVGATLALTMIGTVLAGCGGGSAATSGGSVLTGTNGDPSNGPSGAPWGSVQIAEGLDEDGGYDLNWDVAQSAAAALQLLSAGKVDMAQSSAPTAYAAAKLDPDLRVIGFLNGPAYVLVAPESSGITTAADLDGKTVGVMTLGSASHLMARGAVKEAGLDPDKDVKYLPVSVGAPMAQALNSGTIDVLAGWEGMWQSISALTDVPLQPVKSVLHEVPGMMLHTTSQETIDNRREDLVSYMENFYKSCALAAADPVRAVENHWEVFSNVKPPANEYDQQLENQASWNQGFYEVCYQDSADTGLPGVLSDEEVKTTYEFLRANNILEDDVDYSAIVDTSISEEAVEGLDLEQWATDYLKENPSN